MTPEYVLRKSLCRLAFCGHRLPEDATEEQKEKARQEDVKYALRLIEDMSYSSEYAEPGYTQPKKGILFSDWNYLPRGIGDLLSRMGYELEWEDEWTTCSDCGKALRTSADSYSWQPSYFLMYECEMYCKECADIPEYLRSKENEKP